MVDSAVAPRDFGSLEYLYVGTGTLLLLDPIGLPFWSGRQLTQTLTPIKEIASNRQNLPRTLNGQLINLTPTIFLKYASTISCKDQAGPSRDLVWPGTVITVSCAATLSYPVGLAGAPSRPVVPGSSVTANGFVTYSPILHMMVMSYDDSWSEWEHQYSWKLDLEEI